MEHIAYDTPFLNGNNYRHAAPIYIEIKYVYFSFNQLTINTFKNILESTFFCENSTQCRHCVRRLEGTVYTQQLRVQFSFCGFQSQRGAARPVRSPHGLLRPSGPNGN